MINVQLFIILSKSDIAFYNFSQLLTIINVGCEVLPAAMEIRERLNNTTQNVTYNVTKFLKIFKIEYI